MMDVRQIEAKQIPSIGGLFVIYNLPLNIPENVRNANSTTSSNFNVVDQFNMCSRN